MKYIFKFNETQDLLSDVVKPQGYTKDGIRSAYWPRWWIASSATKKVKSFGNLGK
jgi:hypothetical protein